MRVGRLIFARTAYRYEEEKLLPGTYKYSESTFTNVYSFYLKYARRLYVFYVMRWGAVLWVSCFGYTGAAISECLMYIWTEFLYGGSYSAAVHFIVNSINSQCRTNKIHNFILSALRTHLIPCTVSSPKAVAEKFWL